MSLSGKIFPEEKFYVSHYTRTSNVEDIIKSRALQPVKIQKEIFESENTNSSEFSEPYYYESAAEYGNQEKYAKSNFYSIIFPDSKGKPIFRTHNKWGELSDTYTYFIFSPKIIEDNAKMVGTRGVTEPPVFCKGWTYGKINPDRCNYYNNDLSLKENLNNWRNSILVGIERYEKDPYAEKTVQVESLTLGTEIMMEGEMPIDLDLMYIYIPKSEFAPGNYPKNFYKKLPDLKEMEEELRKEAEESESEIQKMIDKYPELPWIREDPFKKSKSNF